MSSHNNQLEMSAFFSRVQRERKEHLPHDRLTRYGTYERLESTIRDGLFIPKASKFSDKNEGVLRYFGEKDGGNKMLSRAAIRASMDWIYVSCWYDDIQESHAMWQLYGEPRESIAIETTHQNLRLAWLRARFGMQTYIDDVRYKSPDDHDFHAPEGVRVFNNRPAPADPIPLYAALFCYLKHRGYEYEKEVRLAAIDENASSTLPNPRDFVRLPPIATREMITSVILGPETPRSLEMRTAEMLTKNDIDIKLLRRSSLEDPVARSD